MAKQPAKHLYSIFGFLIWGDLGPVTMYRNKQGKIVAFSKTWPDKPPSAEQEAQRLIFTEAAADWQTLTACQRGEWETASRRASLCMHGYDLFVHWKCCGDDQAIQTLERQTGTTLLPP